MAEIKKGSIVLAKAGRDKNAFFAVLEVGERELLLADGKRRPIERPKKKNTVHVAATSNVLGAEALNTNRSLRRAINELTASGAKAE
ncbi:MAG: KOW domain-containing RNA-binding protein [Oscillospiraceae bacterium]|jgi:ribosomal protein L14E/L6E/L27E|nr:KOW domain-containing RNA-binding protein [Oscillospiraceae bacterium]